MSNEFVVVFFFLCTGVSVSLSYDGYVLATGGDRFNLNFGGCWVFIFDGSKYSQLGGRIIGTGSIGPDVHFGKTIR